MITAGIDLSADVKKTGVASIEWSDGRAVVVDLSVGQHDDAALCELIRAVDKTGIDCPLGWPSPFIDYLIAHRAGGHDLVVPETRHALTQRTTDIHVTARTGTRPLSVSADRIGSAAMRCAAVLSILTRSGARVDRTGQTGPIVEVYPAAALKFWGLPNTGYKGTKATETGQRSTLVSRILRAMPWLDLGDHRESCLHSDDALDAVLCAVIAGLSRQGLCEPVPESALQVAQAEGWVALPTTGALTAVEGSQ
ncbi:DUF429 domain-containing protein [Nocardioides campestrisoli]|uniref:DUF429 domain-containing protein n=1 Tax=Nocardioides campestrisoli TaxID=2736757 RepID=UPI00163D9C83|nr:DUF429 domain-containing protein [Nocardioides campestrisoli]